MAKCGLEFCIEFVKFSFAAAFHIVFLFNLVNLKKHRLRLWILELKFFEFPALRQYFFVTSNCFEKKQLWKINFSILKILNFFKKILKKFIRKSKKIIVNILKIEYLNNWLFNEIWQLLLYFFEKFTENLNSEIQKVWKKIIAQTWKQFENKKLHNFDKFWQKKAWKYWKTQKLALLVTLYWQNAGLNFTLNL